MRPPDFPPEQPLRGLRHFQHQFPADNAMKLLSSLLCTLSCLIMLGVCLLILKVLGFFS